MATSEVRSTISVVGNDGGDTITPLADGGWLIDTPGFRAVSLWLSGRGIERAFVDVFDSQMIAGSGLQDDQGRLCSASSNRCW